MGSQGTILMMRVLPSILGTIAALICSCHADNATTDCMDGILLVGGKTKAGPSTQITLLSGKDGFCEQSGFPDLPFPLVNPGAYLARGYLFVCGFPGEFPCMYTQRGWSEWIPVLSRANQTDYKMTYSDRVGSVMMVSKDTEMEATYRIQHNPVHHNPGGMTQWMQISGSPFSLGKYREFSDAELSGYNGDLYLSGGFDLAEGAMGSTAGSVASVARWSVSGSEIVSGPPAFEDGLVPDLSDQWGGGKSSISGREGHASAVFTDSLVVSGGFCHHIESCHWSVDCCRCNSCKTLHGAEYYDGLEWRNMADMVHARAHFGLQPMCGMLVALGGVTVQSTGDGLVCSQEELISSLEVAWSLDGEWVEEDWLEMPEARGYFTALSVSGMECM